MQMYLKFCQFFCGLFFLRGGFESAGRASEGACSRAGLARARYTGVLARFLSSISICIVSWFGQFLFSFSLHLLFALTLVLSHLLFVLGYLFGLGWGTMVHVMLIVYVQPW